MFCLVMMVCGCCGPYVLSCDDGEVVVVLMFCLVMMVCGGCGTYVLSCDDGVQWLWSLCSVL